MSKIPVIVITGFFGAGKTTLLNRLLSEPVRKRYAIIVNEFCDLGIDGDLLVDVDEHVIEVNNGCICCRVRGDLIRSIGQLLAKRLSFDAIIIETTGLADPGPLAQTFFVEPTLQESVQLDSIIAVVDAKWALKRLSDWNEAKAQIAVSDVILLNKVDTVTEDECDACEALVRDLNPFAPLYRSRRCDSPVECLLGTSSYELSNVWLSPVFRDHNFNKRQKHNHTASVFSVSMVQNQELDPDKFVAWMNVLGMRDGGSILRLKGIIALRGYEQRFVVHGVQTSYEGQLDRAWEPDEPRTSKLVVIAQSLDASTLELEFARCGA